MRDAPGARAVVVVGVGGPSGAGKTTLAAKVAEVTGATVLSLESFVDRARIVDGNGDDPTLVDWGAVERAVGTLRDGGSVVVGDATVSAAEGSVLVVEGLFALDVRLLPLLDVPVAINGGVHNDLIKRVVRDTNRLRGQREAAARGMRQQAQQGAAQAGEEVCTGPPCLISCAATDSIASLTQARAATVLHVTNKVFPMYKAFIEPTLKFGKIKIHSVRTLPRAVLRA